MAIWGVFFSSLLLISKKDEHRKYWKDLGNGFYHYNKDIDYGMQAISFTISKGATRILIRHFMS